MQNKTATKRYIQIITCFQLYKTPTFAQIRSFVHRIDEASDVPDRTIKRDLQALKYEFGLDINYNFSSGHYSLNMQHTDSSMEHFIRLLQFTDSHLTLQGATADLFKYAQYLYLEKGQPHQGVALIQPLLQLIHTQKIISLTYFAFSHDLPKTYILHPYHLMQYQMRWYLLAKDDFKKQIRTLALERITNIKDMGATFVRDIDFVPAQHFKFTYGITYKDDVPEEICLRFSNSEKKYLTSLPLHESMKIIDEQDTYFTVSIYVVPNIELEMQILSYGERVQVLSPLSLKMAVQQRISKALAAYIQHR